MNRYHLVSLVLFILGIGFLIYGVFAGEVEAGFILVFPFFMGSGIYAIIGVVLIFSAMILFMFGFMRLHMDDMPFPQDEEYPEQKEKIVKGGGVVLIGPIPIVFGSNWKIAVTMMILAAIIMLFLVLFMTVL